MMLVLLRHAARTAPSLTGGFGAATSRLASAASSSAVAELEDPALPAPSFIVGDARPPPPVLELGPAIAAVKSLTRSKKTDETIEAAFRLGTDPRRGDHAVRGAATLPHGTGAVARVAVFADGVDADAARAAGADVVGGDDLVAALADGGGSAINFDRALATPSLMPRVARAARVLGPRGLMPNPKLGTVVEGGGLAAAVAAAKSGRIAFRADRGGVVAAPLGRASFTDAALAANYGALAAALLAARPKGLKGGGWAGYVEAASLATTQGRGSVRVAVGAVAAAAAAARGK